MAACLTFVFLGLLEFAYVNVQSRVQIRRKSMYPVTNGMVPKDFQKLSKLQERNEVNDFTILI